MHWTSLISKKNNSIFFGQLILLIYNIFGVKLINSNSSLIPSTDKDNLSDFKLSKEQCITILWLLTSIFGIGNWHIGFIYLLILKV